MRAVRDYVGGPKDVLEIGSSLREARRRRGVGLSEASAATMIRARYLEALEQERPDALPEGPYQRSFLREYAEYLGLDGDILVAEWMLRFRPPAPEATAPPPRRAAVGVALDELRHRRGLILALALVVAGFAVWELSRSGSPTVQSPPAITVSPPRGNPPAAAAAAASARTVHLKPKTIAALELTAVHGPSWLLARLGSSLGPVLAEQTLQPGQTARFGLKKPLWLRLGAPWNLAAAIGGRSVSAALPSLTGNVLVTTRGVTPD
jgi:cytoskeleton protein RodZ